ncbi:hypothetical protein MVEG_08219 [Podila verticillata NRRL 6337]|nr:hypothetical protein MVEG_08219 [Podila verticillata NRRL 6337]
MAFPTVSLWAININPGELSSQGSAPTKMESQILQDEVNHSGPVFIVTDIVESVKQVVPEDIPVNV